MGKWKNQQKPKKNWIMKSWVNLQKKLSTPPSGSRKKTPKRRQKIEKDYWKKSQKKYLNSKRKRLLIIKRVFLVDSVVSRSKEKISKTSSNQRPVLRTNQKPNKNLQNQRSTVVKNQKNQNHCAS